MDIYKTYDKKDIDRFCNDFKLFLESENIGSKSQYISNISKYLNTFVLGYVERNDFYEFFSSKRLKKHIEINKSSVCKASLTKFLLLLYKQKLIDKNQYYSYKEIIIEELKQDTINNRNKKQDFLTPEEISNLFSNKMEYRSGEAEISKAIFALTFFCGMEHRYIVQLKTIDYIKEEGLIRNSRYSEDNVHVVQWIKLNDYTIEVMNEYITYRNKLNIESDSLFIYKGKQIDSSGINSINQCTNWLGNDTLFQHEINSQMLVRSMILHKLISTKGLFIYDILKLQGIENQQLNKQIKNAWQKYCEISSYDDDRNMNILNTSNLHEILNGVIDSKHRDILLNNNDDDIEDVDEQIDNYFEDINKYSEERDITMEDVYDYENEINTKTVDTVSIQRLVRNTSLAEKIKSLYKNRCQLCGYQLRSSNGGYRSEAHHLKPFNRTHKGDDTFRNMIVLCPNCHTQFDELYYAINPDTLEINCIFNDDQFQNEKLDFIDGHTLGKEYLQYMWDLFLAKKEKMELSNNEEEELKNIETKKEYNL